MRERLARATREPAVAMRAIARRVSVVRHRISAAPGAVVHWPRERSARRAGEAAWRAGDDEGAYEHFRVAVTYGTHPWSWLRFARSSLRRADVDTALDALVHAVSVAPPTPAVRDRVAALLQNIAPGANAPSRTDELMRAPVGSELAFIGVAAAECGAYARACSVSDQLASSNEPADALVVEALVRFHDAGPEKARQVLAGAPGAARSLIAAQARLLLDLDERSNGWRLLAPKVDRASTALIARYASDLFNAGEFTLAKDAATVAAARTPPGKGAAHVRELCDRELGVLRNGVAVGVPVADLTYEGDPRTVCYLLQNSLPYMSGGYATRTHGLLQALARRGRTMHGVTRPGFPYNVVADDVAVPDSNLIDDVVYHRIGEPRPYNLREYADYCDAYVSFLEPVAREARAGIVHAASFYWNGIVANALKERLGIPSIYEVRGLGELTRLSRHPYYRATEGYRLTAKLEVQAAAGADAVITITDALRREMIERGIEPGKIVVVPNGVDTERFSPRARDADLEATYGLAGKVVIGFVGTLVDYEGLDLLLRAVDRLRRDRDDFRVLIVGSGGGEDDLHALAEELDLGNVVTFTGRVPHTEVERYLSVIDITPFPRRALPVCEMVSPLKPLESMASGKVVIASNVAALAEMVDHGNTGLLFEKEQLDDFTRVLGQLIDDGELRRQLAGNARQWVEVNRSWDALSMRVDALYDALLSGSPVDAPLIEKQG